MQTNKEATMLSKIMVPLDGSSFGEFALPLAVSLAKRSGALLHLVHVDVPLVSAYAGGPGGPFVSAPGLEAERYERARDYLAAVQQRVVATPGISATCEILDGPVSATLVEYAESAGIDLIVMTTHGRGPLVRLWLGSVADGLVRRATVPLLFVRPLADADPATPAAPFRHVLIPLDGSELAEQVIAPALDVAGHADVDYTLMRIAEPYMVFDPALRRVAAPEHEQTRLHAEQATEYLATIADRLRPAGVHASTDVMIAEHAATALVAAAHEGQYDLIAISTHGRGGLNRLLVGSVADKILRASSCPVLIVRPVDHTTSAA